MAREIGYPHLWCRYCGHRTPVFQGWVTAVPDHEDPAQPCVVHDWELIETAPPEPTDEQLESLTLTLGLPTLPTGLRPPYWREAMLNLHRLVQRSADGDEAAGATLQYLRIVLGRTG